MKRRSQTKAQTNNEAEKKSKEKIGALTLDQFSSDVIWQVGAPQNLNVYIFKTNFDAVLAGITVLVT